MPRFSLRRMLGSITALALGLAAFIPLCQSWNLELGTFDPSKALLWIVCGTMIGIGVGTPFKGTPWED